ncbi:hypothetical protein TELCIR_11144 [Teladorsagia circumcincta]|uniref:Uncharacterized protein n=1 Tax=Teladorsagia circumcincta TaxID=45464 RepID=A0A2G9UCC5_TELCI|nr:hypothetical protein TELCIR_11144 [Teladorsagia circumcincta]
MDPNVAYFRSPIERIYKTLRALLIQASAIPDDEENSDDGAADEIDAINDETFGDDVHVPLDSELEDYAAQTACLRLDDPGPWDTPGCSKAPAPDASNVPLPDFDVFGTSSFSSFGSETMLEDLERGHLQRPTNISKVSNMSAMPPVAVNVADLERRFIEESSGMPPPANQMIPSCSPPQFPPPLPSPHAQLPPRMAPNAPPNFGGVPPMHIPTLLPPFPPMLIPCVPFWLEHLAGRAPCLPPGCPPVPPLLRMCFDTVKDPMVVMDMIRASNAGMVPPPFPVPPQTFDRRSQWQRKAPGMPSGRTIEDLAFDQFAGYMSCKEREWLVKIQILQCQGTGNPYDDDYYYTSWREKQIAKGWRPSRVVTPQGPSLDKVKIGKGRSVVARALTVGTPRDVARVVLSLFSVMSLCSKRCIEDINCEVVPHMFTGLMELSREQLMALSSAVNIDSLKENISNKNAFCRDAFITLLYVCAKRKAISQGVVRWLCGPPDELDFTNGWSSSLSLWREQIPGLLDSDVQMFAEWLLLLCDNTHYNSLAKVLAKALLSCR